MNLAGTAVTLITIIRPPLRHQNHIGGVLPIADHSRYCLSAIEKLHSRKGAERIYTPTADEFDLAHSLTHSTAMRIGFLVLLKTFQRLGHFIPAHKVPRPIAEHISLIYGVHYQAMEWEAYDGSGCGSPKLDSPVFLTTSLVFLPTKNFEINI